VGKSRSIYSLDFALFETSTGGATSEINLPKAEDIENVTKIFKGILNIKIVI